VIVSVHQPHYLPWMGYFDKIARSDCFVILDNVQYKKREFQNRNLIKSKTGAAFLTVPVVTKDRYFQTTGQVEIDNSRRWRQKHFGMLTHNYAHAPEFETVVPILEKFYMSERWDRLIDLCVAMLREMMRFMRIDVPIKFESDLGVDGVKTQRIANICNALGADTYLSGSGAKVYLDEDLLQRYGVDVEYQQFRHPVYPQVGDGFLRNLAVVDLLFNCGAESADFLMAEGVLQ